MQSAVMLSRSSLSTSSKRGYCTKLRLSGTKSEQVTRGRGGIAGGKRNLLFKTVAHSPSMWTSQQAKTGGRGSVRAVLAAFLSIAALMCINSNTFWSHARRSLTLSLRSGSGTVALRVCGIPSSTGWFFQLLWPYAERFFSGLAPAVLLLTLGLYGLCILRLSLTKHRRAVQPAPILMDPLAEASSSRVSRERGAARNPNKSAIEALTTDLSLVRRQPLQRLPKCQFLNKSRKQLCLVLLLALLTSVAAVQESTVEMVAALSPTFIGLCARDWLLVLLCSHSLIFVVQCAALPLCIALSAQHSLRHCALHVLCRVPT